MPLVALVEGEGGAVNVFSGGAVNVGCKSEFHCFVTTSS